MTAAEYELNLQILQRLRDYTKREAANDFAAFLTYINPRYRLEWFHRVIADNCQALFEGRIKNLMVFMPPQHGKSEIISRTFPAWALGCNPDCKIVGCSYAADLAQQFSRAIQRTLDSEEYAEVFPDTSITGIRGRRQGYLRNVDVFEVVDHKGFYKAVGVGGSLTGTPVDIAIIDDPVKDAAEAMSTTYRQRVWDWYNSVLTTRLHNKSRQLFIMTRWHEDDLAGRILAAEPQEWKVISIPAICEVENDGGLSHRHIGEALWEERHSIEKLIKQQERSARMFSALYQQHPTIEGGNIVKRDWYRHITAEEFSRLHHAEPIVFFIDTAFTDKKINDPTGIIATTKIGNDLFVLHAEKAYLKFPDLIKFIPTYCRAHGYTARSSIRIEPKANGLSVIDQLKDLTGLNVTKTPSPKDSKETRLNAASPCIESGRVVLVDGAWNEAYIDEVCGFPSKPHDEFVDVTCYAIDFHLTNPFKPIDKNKLASIVY